jgi:tRNA-(ms[2]io[6]A)-hydroxylase
VLHLQSATDPSWIRAIRPHLATLLLDHAHCEKKAASTAINLVFRYQPIAELMRPLSELAREELTHFELLLGVLERRGIAFEALPPSPYAAELHRAVRDSDPDRLLDTLLVCALIEARSCERMRLLSEGLDDPELAALYRSLLASEARHHATYVELACVRWPRDAVERRLGELAIHEARVIAAAPAIARLHGSAPSVAVEPRPGIGDRVP